MQRILMSQEHHDNNLTNTNAAFAQYTKLVGSSFQFYTIHVILETVRVICFR